jgi:peptide/nickel transport system ATP-binding protein
VRSRTRLVEPVTKTQTAGDGEGDDLLIVDKLSVEFRVGRHGLRAVDDVSLRIRRGEIVGLVGESGCGKSTLGMALLRLVPPPGEIVGGLILFEQRDLLALSEREMTRLRGAAISLIVQDALAAMNPVTTVGEQITEVIRDHVGGTKHGLRERGLEMLRRVHLPNPELNMRRYAHELSGGMQQRVVIAQALILGSRLIVADEPTTALDVTVQAQILSLLRQAREETGTGVLFITHDLATVAELCDRVLVMYAGKVVESGAVRDLFRQPKHPYTQALLAGLLPLRGEPPTELDALSGQPPQLENWPLGCRFHPRCALRAEMGNPGVCVAETPQPDETAPHWAACHFVTSSPRTEALPDRPDVPDHG